MAQIVGGIATSHIPSIGKAIVRGLQNEPYWRDFFCAFCPVHEWLDEVRPDVAPRLLTLRLGLIFNICVFVSS